MPKLILFAFTFLYSLILFGQNRIEGGVKTGYWIENYDENGSCFVSHEGVYRKTSLSKYNTLRDLGRNCYEVQFKASTTLLFYYGDNLDNISVKDSIWTYYDKESNVVEIQYYENGIQVWRKSFDSNGTLQSYFLEDFENDTTFYFDYIDNRIFKKAFFPPNEKNRQTVTYYPNERLLISNAEPKFNINFLTKPKDEKVIFMIANEDLVIDSMKVKSITLSLIDSNSNIINLPASMKKHAQYKLIATAAPTAANYTPSDTITVFTNGGDMPLKIYASVDAYHIGYSTVEITDTIKLSKTNDKFLILPSMGTVTDAIIETKNKVKHRYRINGITKIDLSAFDADIYSLMIASCNTGGRMVLVISE